MSKDMSSGARTTAIQNKTLAVFHKNNPASREINGQSILDQSIYLQRITGQSTENCCTATVACSPPTTITNFEVTGFNSAPPPYDGPDNLVYNLSWDPVTGATSYAVTVNMPLVHLEYPTTTTADIYFTWGNPYPEVEFTLTASSSCGSTDSTINTYPCFLAGSLVQMADGTTKNIEDVLVGDSLLGAFGEINVVLALHRPLVGDSLMCNINNEHHTTNHHPHISLDKQFYCGNPSLVETNTYGHEHAVIDETGQTVQRLLHGLKKGRVQKLEVGVNLKTVEGSRVVQSLDTYKLPSDTQLYNLVTGGSHTYYVDGYAVTGWPREDDFNYDTWTPIPTE